MSGFDPEKYRESVTGVTLDDIGGNPEVIEQIQSFIELISNPEHFEAYGAEFPRGVLFYGPPGTGKTLAAKIIASTLGLPFYKFTKAEVINVWQGESANIMKGIFQRTQTPCVLFWDEIDALFPQNSFISGDGATGDVQQVFLDQVDGLNSRKGIIVVGATNKIELIPAAVLRPGRLSIKIFVGLPNQEAREKILTIHLNKSIEHGRKNGVTLYSADIFNHLSELAEDMKGFSGAHIEEVVRRCKMLVARKRLSDKNFLITNAELHRIIQQVRNENGGESRRMEL